MRITVRRLRQFIKEANRPESAKLDYSHASRANWHLDQSVSSLESLGNARPDIDHVIADLIDAIHRVQETIDKFKIKDDRFQPAKLK